MFIVVLATAGHAQAQLSRQPTLRDSYFALELSFDFAGGVSREADDLADVVAPGQEDLVELDAMIALGGAIRYVRSIYRALALGARIGVLSWRSFDATAGGRNIAIDLSLLPQLRFSLSRAGELYVTVPIGGTFNFLNDLDQATFFRNPRLFGLVGGFGWNLAFMIGARLALSSDVGVFAEAGYALHHVTHDAARSDRTVGGVRESDFVDLDISWSQIALNAGVTF